MIHLSCLYGKHSGVFCDDQEHPDVHLVHDLKNPVNIIETGAKSLLDKQDRYGSLNQKQEKVIRRMLRNALKIRNLANSMLEVDMAAMG